VVARLDPASEIKQGDEVELWVDATKLQLFDPDDGRNLMVETEGPPAVGAAAGGDPPATATRDEAS
jgi:multiple sugar transport system ATP-binding protein